MTLQTAAIKNKGVTCELLFKKIPASINLQALSETFAQLKSASILGGNTAVTDANRFSYWMAEPKEVFEFQATEQRPFERLQQVLDKYRFGACGENNLPKGIFCGGWVGYFSYELAGYIEKLPQTAIDDIEMPLIRLCFYDRVICYDHIGKICWLIALQLSNDRQRPDEKLAALEQLLAESQKAAIKTPPPGELYNIDFSKIRCNMDTDYYFKTFERIKRHIYDGDVYQINFSQRFECDYNSRPIQLYHWQNCYNPSGYAAYIDGGDFHIVSASPEMFITITDGLISTKPIKGTRPRLNENNLHTDRTNAKNFDELVNSEKEQAELNMIIDLERNDLVRVCEYGTRKVVQPRTIESYPTVFHAVATVAGQLRRDITFCDILKAMFPGGSITGAPKIRSLEIIDHTEPTARGVYTGSIGFIGLDGSVCLNIAIRTIIIRDCRAYIQTGGGIVADSDPKAEWDETITKARALLAGVRATDMPC